MDDESEGILKLDGSITGVGGVSIDGWEVCGCDTLLLCSDFTCTACKVNF